MTTKNIGDDLGHLGHQLSICISVGHQHSKDVINITVTEKLAIKVSLNGRYQLLFCLEAQV